VRVSEREPQRPPSPPPALPPGARAGIPQRLCAPPFVGRHRELEVLQRCLADTLACHPRLALVEGEAGVGKSRLLTEIRERARGRGAQVLCGRCSEDLPLPYRPFVEALEEPLRDALGTEADALVQLLQRGPGEEPDDQSRRSGSGPEQLHLFREISRGCLTLARQRPTMLVVEDLHWADRSTLDLLEHVVFALADAAMRAPVPLIVLCTCGRTGSVRAERAGGPRSRWKRSCARG
jgi:predicted ATPase